MAHKTRVGGTNYEITGGKCRVSATNYAIKKGRTLVGGAGYDISFVDYYPILADNTPEQIQKAAQDGVASSLWAVGDVVPITLNGTVGALTFSNETYYAFILGFDHNSGVEGSDTIHFQLGKTSASVDIAFVDDKYAAAGTTVGFRMNTEVSSSGGWESSYMRNTICSQFLSALPAAWQSVIASCTKYSDNNGDGNDTASNVTATSDKIWLLAEFEVLGACTGANSAEQNYQKWYDYYANGNSKAKCQHSSTTTPCCWWLRSVRANDTAYFRYINTSGNGASNKYAYYSYGFAPGFMVA